MPKLSIITVNYNNRLGLKKTINSVIHQYFKDFEYLIIDGNSSDGSKAEILAVADKLSYYVSESDNGIYHAMNKGIQKSKGDYCLFLNSGDCLSDKNVLNKLFSETFSEDIIYTSAYFGNHIYRYPNKLNLSFLLTKSVCHQTTLIKRDLFERYKFYNETYKIYSDWDFLLNMILIKNCSYRYVDSLSLAKIEIGGISQQFRLEKLRNEEKNVIIRNILNQLTESKITDRNFSKEIVELIFKYTELKDSKLIKATLRLEKTSLFHFLKRIYYRIKR